MTLAAFFAVRKTTDALLSPDSDATEYSDGSPRQLPTECTGPSETILSKYQ
jgi:hypothetical protein